MAPTCEDCNNPAVSRCGDCGGRACLSCLQSGLCPDCHLEAQRYPEEDDAESTQEPEL